MTRLILGMTLVTLLLAATPALAVGCGPGTGCEDAPIKVTTTGLLADDDQEWLQENALEPAVDLFMTARELVLGPVNDALD